MADDKLNTSPEENESLGPTAPQGLGDPPPGVGKSPRCGRQAAGGCTRSEAPWPSPERTGRNVCSEKGKSGVVPHRPPGKGRQRLCDYHFLISNTSIKTLSMEGGKAQ